MLDLWLGNATDAVRRVMAHTAQPRQIVEAVRASLRTKLDVMHMHTCAAFARVTGAVEAF
jgi:hypothetical protein